ncbi:MAG TPA: hypothetical protein VF609_16625 [Flavisolibacter sp.]
MTANILTQQKKAKLKFFAVYIVSVVLILIIFAAFRTTDQPTVAAVESVSTPSAGQSGQLAEADALLHSRMNDLDKLRLAAVQNPANAARSDMAIQTAEADFTVLLDSLEKQKAELSNVDQQRLSLLLENFKNELQAKSQMHSNYIQLVKKQSVPPVTTNNEEVERLRSALEDKEKTISSLQQQLASKPVSAPRTTNDDAETKKKLASLKAAYDRLQIQNATMEKSYKIVVEDNRRLVTQLQSPRKQ